MRLCLIKDMRETAAGSSRRSHHQDSSVRLGRDPCQDRGVALPWRACVYTGKRGVTQTERLATAGISRTQSGGVPTVRELTYYKLSAQRDRPVGRQIEWLSPRLRRS